MLDGGAGRCGIAAVVGDLVGGPVLVAMVVFEAEAGRGTGDDPRARAVFADVERDLDLVFAAGAHLHDEGLAGEGGVGGAGACDDFSSVGLAAECAEFAPECFLLGGQSAGGQREEQGEQEKAEARHEGTGEVKVKVKVRGRGEVNGEVRVKGEGAVARGRTLKDGKGVRLVR